MIQDSQPPRTPGAHDHTSTLQIMVHKFSVMGRGVNAPHRRSNAQDDLDGVPHVSMDYGFLGEKESEEQVSLLLVIREWRHKMTWAMLVPRKGTEFPWVARRAARFTDQLGHNRVTLRCENQPAIEALAREIGQARQSVPERPPVEKASPTGSLSVRWGSLLVRPEH